MFIYSLRTTATDVKSWHWQFQYKLWNSTVNTCNWVRVNNQKITYGHSEIFRTLLKLAFQWYIWEIVPTIFQIGAPNIVDNSICHLEVPEIYSLGGRSKCIQYVADKIQKFLDSSRGRPATNHLEVSLADQLTDRGATFLLFDNINSQNEPRSWIFTTQDNLEALRNATAWLVDATFASFPN